jgi:tight adherence protein B
MNRLWVTSLLVFLAAVFGTLSLALISELLGDWRRRRQVAKRLKPVLEGKTRRSGSGDLIRELEEPEGFTAILASLLPGGRHLPVLLDQAGLDWSVGTFLVMAVGLGFSLGLAAFVALGTFLPATFAAAFGGSTPYLYARRRRSARFRAFEEQFPEAIDLLTRAIRAGHPLSSGMRMVGEEGPLEVAKEFRRTSEEQRFGLPFEESLLGMVDRTDLVDVRIFAIAVLVQREVGGNLAEILENLATTIRRRFYLRRQLRVYTAQGRMTGYALAALPVAVGTIIFFLQPDYVMILFSGLMGWFLVITALVLQGIGALWIKKIIAIDM